MQQTPVAIVEPPVPKDPPPEFEFLADPPTISALDLYVLLYFTIAILTEKRIYFMITRISQVARKISKSIGVINRARFFYPNLV